MIPMKREYLGVRSCTEECHLQGYPYAAVQDARFCMCSRQFGRYGAAEDESQCMTQCIAGSENERCGGPWKNAVYEIGELIGHLHDDAIWLKLSEFISFFISLFHWSVPPLNLINPTLFTQEKRNKLRVSTLRWNFPMSSFSWKTNTRRCYWWQWCGSGGELEAWPQEWYSMAQADLNYCNLPFIQVYVVKKLMDRSSQKIETKSRNSDGDVW